MGRAELKAAVAGGHRACATAENYSVNMEHLWSPGVAIGPPPATVGHEDNMVTRSVAGRCGFVALHSENVLSNA
jgi:hypothetical protein